MKCSDHSKPRTFLLAATVSPVSRIGPPPLVGDAATFLPDNYTEEILLREVSGQADTAFMNIRSVRPQSGALYRAKREILVRGERIGRILVEMDDARSQQELRGKQSNYALVLAVQLGVSLALIVLFLNKRLLSPLRSCRCRR